MSKEFERAVESSTGMSVEEIRSTPLCILRSRSLRRHHRERMIARAKRIYRRANSRNRDSDEWIETMSRKNHDHLTACSCEMCGNPRRHFNQLSVQERRSQGFPAGPANPYKIPWKIIQKKTKM